MSRRNLELAQAGTPLMLHVVVKDDYEETREHSSKINSVDVK